MKENDVDDDGVEREIACVVECVVVDGVDTEDVVDGVIDDGVDTDVVDGVDTEVIVVVDRVVVDGVIDDSFDVDADAVDVDDDDDDALGVTVVFIDFSDSSRLLGFLIQFKTKPV